jgi:uncharacterized protein YbjT (DUF2867 family)
LSAVYLITGATGNVGREVVRALRQAGEPVRALVRSTATHRTDDGIDYVTGDLTDLAGLRPALNEVRGLFLLPGYPGMPQLLAAAADAGIERVVLLSGGSADGDRRNAVTRYLAESEDAVGESALAATTLRPSMFMSNTLQWRDQLRAGNVIRAPFGQVAAAVLDPADIGAVAALALRAPGDDHLGRTYRLTGPQALRPAERVEVLAEVLSRPLRFEALTDDEARAELSATMPAEYVEAFFDFYVTGSLDESPVLPTVAELLDRPPGAFADWARSHAAELIG